VPQQCRRREAGQTSDLLDAGLALLEHLLRASETLPRDPRRGCRPGLGAEPPREGPLRHQRARREDRHAELGREVLAHPGEQGRQGVGVARQRGLDVLRLPAVPPGRSWQIASSSSNS